jgi:hypothetical protein
MKKENRMNCDHNEMVENDDKEHVWKCAHCGYVYGNDLLSPVEVQFSKAKGGDE